MINSRLDFFSLNFSTIVKFSRLEINKKHLHVFTFQRDGNSLKDIQKHTNGEHETKLGN